MPFWTGHRAAGIALLWSGAA